jgi:maltose alpha-D-glucosyltransferase/alpha-amylase
VVPIAYVSGAEGEEMRKWHPEAVIADLRAGSFEGTLIDALYSPHFVHAMADVLARRRALSGSNGQIVGAPAPALRQFDACVHAACSTTPLTGEQSNSSVLLGDDAIMKVVRRFDEGVNPGVEIGRYLGEVAQFPHAPRVGGSIEYRRRGDSVPPATLAVLEEFVPNEGDGWRYVVDALEHGLEEALAKASDEDELQQSPRGLLTSDPWDLEPAHPLVGPHMEWASLLGRRTAELHLALVSSRNNPAFVPEPLTAQDRQALFHGARSLTRQVLRDVASKGVTSTVVQRVLDKEEEIIDRLRRFSASPIQAFRIRCHGDLHLGQVLWTGKDFFVIDFEGEPSRSLGFRRLKRPAAYDLAGMIRSLHYAGQAAALRINLEYGATIEAGLRRNYYDWLAFWHRWVAGRFLDSYLETAGANPYLPSTRSDVIDLLDFFRLEKAVYELNYEVNSRPAWVDIPASGILDILNSEP